MMDNEQSKNDNQGVERPPGVIEYVLPYNDAEGVALSPVALLNTLLRHRRLLVTWALVLALVAGVLTLLMRKYRAEASFSPQSNQPTASSLAGLASQFGFNVGTMSGGPSLDFYAAIANSRATLTVAATTRYRVAMVPDGRDTVEGTLIELLRVSGSTPLDRLQRTVKKLDGMVSVTKDADAGIVTVTVTAKSPSLAEQLDRRLLALVNEVNLSQHQAQAAAEREFVVGRLDEVRMELDGAENALRRFFEENRAVERSPRLLVEQGRLQRRVDFLQQVYLTLAQSYERARLEQARDTPLITVIDAPEGSAKKTGRLVVSVIVAGMLGGILGLVHSIVKDYMASQRAAASPEYLEFAQLRATAVKDLTALPRAIAATARSKQRSHPS